MAPKVSVISSVYNKEKYFRQFMDSLMAQTLKDVEFIIINNGSTDNCAAILESYASKDERIRVITKEKNIVPSAALNLGIASAKGDYLSLLDADDFYEPTLLQDAYECAVKNDADVVCYSFYSYDDKTGECSPTYYKLNEMPDVCAPQDIADCFSIIIGPQHWSKLFRRDFILKENIQYSPALNCAFDLHFTTLAILSAKRIAKLDKPLLYYRTNQTTNVSATMPNEEKIMYVYKALQEIRDDLTERGLLGAFKKGFRLSAKEHIISHTVFVSLKELSLRERYKMCREFSINPLFEYYSFFVYVHSPQWVWNLWRKTKKCLGIKGNYISLFTKH